MNIEIWSDVACPWCYIGSSNLVQALASFAHRDEVRVVWRSYELDAGAPAVREGTYVEHLARKYGTNPDGARAMLARLLDQGAAAGLDLRFDEVRSGNTFDAHRLLHLAGERGVQRRLVRRLFVAAFTEGRALGERDTLVELAAEVGIAPDEARTVLASGAYASEVRAEEAEAQELGFQGVPVFVFDRRVAVAGARPAADMLDVLQRAWREGAVSAPVEVPDVWV